MMNRGLTGATGGLMIALFLRLFPWDQTRSLPPNVVPEDRLLMFIGLIALLVGAIAAIAHAVMGDKK